MRTNRVICAFVFSLLLTACGQKGALYLEERAPEENGNVEPSQVESSPQVTQREQADK